MPHHAVEAFHRFGSFRSNTGVAGLKNEAMGSCSRKVFIGIITD